jgi:hypothetical protein
MMALKRFLCAIIFLWLVHVWMMIFSSTIAPLASSFLPPLDPLSPGSFSLGIEQSFGFFTDIRNENWKLLQDYHAKMFPNYYIESSSKQEQNLNNFSHANDAIGNYSLIHNSNSWYARNFQVEFICPLARRLPSDSNPDGAKWVSLCGSVELLMYILNIAGLNALIATGLLLCPFLGV